MEAFGVITQATLLSVAAYDHRKQIKDVAGWVGKKTWSGVKALTKMTVNGVKNIYFKTSEFIVDSYDDLAWKIRSMY